ncbi:MAG TPA: ASKHA domain-containing protein, partial [Acidimicrobiales bacterium]|nr:ASKHA domain-containing protein [Acidimicrobiales bacterium]
VAAGIRTGIIKQSGGFLPDHPLLARTSWGPACVLVPAAGTGHGQDILLTRADVSEIQLAKAAIAAGAEILLAAEGIGADQIDEVLIAGAFGTYLNLESAVAIGMLPHLPATRYRQLGNAAGHGARRMLTSRQSRHEAESISRRARYVELTSCPDFAGTFAAQLNFPPPPGALLG